MKKLDKLEIDDSFAEFHIEIDRTEEDDDMDSFYVAGLVRTRTGERADAWAMLSASLCDTDPENTIYENWVLYFIGNILLDIVAATTAKERSMLELIRATASDKRDALFARRKADG